MITKIGCYKVNDRLLGEIASAKENMIYEFIQELYIPIWHQELKKLEYYIILAYEKFSKHNDSFLCYATENIKDYDTEDLWSYYNLLQSYAWHCYSEDDISNLNDMFRFFNREFVEFHKYAKQYLHERNKMIKNRYRYFGFKRFDYPRYTLKLNDILYI